MSTTTIVLTVPATYGDGPLADTSALVGEKTVIFSGVFRGTYQLLGSHDDVNFVPILQFDSGSPAGVRQTMAGAFKSMRVRAATPDATGVVTCEVSGTVGLGQNYFNGTALPAGFTGTSVSVDLLPDFPPTGPESDCCLICRGDFEGVVVVEASLDGTRWDPLCSFRVDRRPEGSPTFLDLGVQQFSAKVRYMRARTSSTVGAGGVVLTMGAGVPAEASPGYGPFVNSDAATQRKYMVVRRGAAPGQALLAQADSVPHLSVVLGTRLDDVAAGASAPVAPFEEVRLVRMDAQPLVGDVVYLSAATAGVGTQTAPPLAVPLGTCSRAVLEAGVWYAEVIPLLPDTTPGTLDTLAQVYAAGTSAADQTMSLLDADGGGIVINGRSASFTASVAFSVLLANSASLYEGSLQYQAVYHQYGAHAEAGALYIGDAGNHIATQNPLDNCWIRRDTGVLELYRNLLWSGAPVNDYVLEHNGSAALLEVGQSGVGLYGCPPKLAGQAGLIQVACAGANGHFGIGPFGTVVNGVLYYGPVFPLTIGKNGVDVGVTGTVEVMAVFDETGTKGIMVGYESAVGAMTGVITSVGTNSSLAFRTNYNGVGGWGDTVRIENTGVVNVYAKKANDTSGINLWNTLGGTGCQVGFTIGTNTLTPAGTYGGIHWSGSTYTGFGVYLPSSLVINSTGVNGLSLICQHASGFVRLCAGGYLETTEVARATAALNFLVGTTAQGATAAKCLVLGNTATAPTTTVDLVHLYGQDNGVGHATLAVYMEEVVQAVGVKTVNEVLPVFINGVLKYIALAA